MKVLSPGKLRNDRVYTRHCHDCDAIVRLQYADIALDADRYGAENGSWTCPECGHVNWVELSGFDDRGRPS